MYKYKSTASPVKKTAPKKTVAPIRKGSIVRSTAKSSYRKKSTYRRTAKKSSYIRHNRDSKLYTNKSLGSGIVIPDIYKCKLEYSADKSLVSTLVESQVWRGNGAYDPDQTGTGGQPSYFDELAAMYSNYRVMGCKITIKILNGGTNLDYVVLYPSISSTAYTVLTDARSNPYSVSTILTGKDGKGYTKLRSYMSSKKMFGVKSIMFDDTMASTVSTTPVSAWYWIFMAQDVGNATKTIYFTTKLTYYMQFENRKQLTQS